MSDTTNAVKTPAFRSRLEREVADELTELGIRWEYEKPVTLTNGQKIYYLPDFHLPDQGSISNLELPRWVEAKPQQFIYDLRDSLGITRQHGDRFAGSVFVAEVHHHDLQDRHIDELWKPKKLAELTGEAVLVIGGVGGTNRLSVVMHADRIEFTREHWIANWKGYEMRIERAARQEMYARQREEWEQRRAIEQADYERRAREQAAADAASRRQALDIIRRYPVTGRNKYGQHCVGCTKVTPIGTGWLRNVTMADGLSKWIVICNECEMAK